MACCMATAGVFWLVCMKSHEAYFLLLLIKYAYLIFLFNLATAMNRLFLVRQMFFKVRGTPSDSPSYIVFPADYFLFPSVQLFCQFLEGF